MMPAADPRVTAQDPYFVTSDTAQGAGAAKASSRAGARAGARAVMLAIVAIAIQFVMVTAYAWATASTAPRNVPVAITGPVRQVAAATGEVELARPGAFRLVPAASPERARADITGKLTYGAIVLTDTGGPRVLVASGASPVVANILTSLATHLNGAGTSSGPASTPPVRDVVPTSPGDPTGTGFAFTVLPIAISSLAAGALLVLHLRRRGYRAVALLVFGAGGGAASVAVAHTWLGILPGNFTVLASVAGLASLAVAAGVSGLAQLGARFGRPAAGIAVAGALIMLAGNPFSGAGTAPEMLPGAWGMAGQCLPNGALATLLRSVAYFDGARSAGPWAVLAAWATAGLLLTVVSRPRPS